MGMTPSDGKAGPVMLHTPLPADREAALLAAWAETVTFVPAETGSPDLDPEPDDPDDEPDSAPTGPGTKVRHVATQAGVEKFHLPLRAPIVAHPKPASHPRHHWQQPRENEGPFAVPGGGFATYRSDTPFGQYYMSGNGPAGPYKWGIGVPGRDMTGAPSRAEAERIANEDLRRRAEIAARTEPGDHVAFRGVMMSPYAQWDGSDGPSDADLLNFLRVQKGADTTLFGPYWSAGVTQAEDFAVGEDRLSYVWSLGLVPDHPVYGLVIEAHSKGADHITDDSPFTLGAWGEDAVIGPTPGEPRRILLHLWEMQPGEKPRKRRFVRTVEVQVGRDRLVLANASRSEVKVVRHVRTPEGSRYFDEPIGAPIVPHPRLAVVRTTLTNPLDTGLAQGDTGVMPTTRNPDFGKRIGAPRKVIQANGSTIYETIGGPQPGQTIDRPVWHIEKRDGVWGVYDPRGAQMPASFVGTSKAQAEKWAMDRANGIPDPDA